MKDFFTIGDAVRTVLEFDPGDDGLAEKSRELTLMLLDETESPFSRDQFKPGHITCTGLVLHPDEPKVLFMHHHKLKRWLLPGGHVEKNDISLEAAAGREAAEETAVELDVTFTPFLAGLDVHGIPGRKKEPFHLHHDLIWCFRATTPRIAKSKEAPDVMWAGDEEWDALGIAKSIRRAITRARSQQ